MKKRNLFIIAGLLFIVLIGMCVGIYFIIKYTDDINKEEKEETPSFETEKSVALYTSRGIMQIYDDYLIEIENNNLKIMDYKTNILFDQDFEDVKYLNAYYGIDNSIYVISSLDYDSHEENSIYSFNLYKIVDNELINIKDFNCEFMQFLYDDNKKVIGIALDDNELISYDGTYLNLQGYTIKSIEMMGSDAYNFSYNDKKIILNKCNMDNCSYAIYDMETKNISEVSYENINLLNNDDYRVKQNGKYGVVGENGDTKLECIYDYIDASNKDVIALYKDNEINIMNYNYEVLNKDPINYVTQIPEDIDAVIYGNFDLIYTEYIENKVLIQYKNENNEYKLYIINEDGSTSILDDIKSFSYDKVLELIYIYDWTKDDMSDKQIKEVWNKKLEKVSNNIKEIKLYDMTITIDEDHQSTIIKDGKTLDEFYYDEETIITDKYIMYNNDLKGETYYYYSV